MPARVHSFAPLGINAVEVEVEVDISGGTPGIVTVGLPDGAVRESRDRVRSALANSGYRYPRGWITVNLAPADIKKIGSGYDLPIALGLLLADGQISTGPEFDLTAFIGELALDGRVRPIRGALPAAICARDSGCRRVVVPAENACEAAVVNEVEVYPAATLSEAVRLAVDGAGPRGAPEPVHVDLASLLHKEKVQKEELDFEDVRGQEHVKRALAVACAGDHNVIMIGPPGSGKSMMARRIPSILPKMTVEEAIETTRVHSVMGLLRPGAALVRERPFRSPHHTVSYAGLVGGGMHVPSPGEISAAHNGVLFLDELPEFGRQAKEALRQPLERGELTIVRSEGGLTFPARMMLVAAMNPCPCGYRTDPTRECRCTSREIARYMGRVSGPLLDRIDLHVEVPPVRYKELSAERGGRRSAEIRVVVERAREIQGRRLAPHGLFTNSRLTEKLTRKYCPLDDSSGALLKTAISELGFSARAYSRILKVARTIADMDESEDIKPQHISEAVQYRTLDRTGIF